MSNHEIYLSLSFFFRLTKFQFVNNNTLFFTIQLKMWRKSVGNQIPRRGLDVYAMKIEFTAVEMF